MSCDAVSGSDPFVVFVVVADESGDTAEATVACVSTLSVSDSTLRRLHLGFRWRSMNRLTTVSR